MPLLLEEHVLSYDFIETQKKSLTGDLGEVTFYFQLTSSKFGKGDRPTLKLNVDYSALCKRVYTGSELVKQYRYECS